MPTNSSIQRERLLLGLLTGPAQMQLYRSNLTFRGAIDDLTAMLPAWIEGLVIAAGRVEEQRSLYADLTRNDNTFRINIPNPDRELLRTLFGKDFDVPGIDPGPFAHHPSTDPNHYNEPSGDTTWITQTPSTSPTESSGSESPSSQPASPPSSDKQQPTTTHEPGSLDS